MNDDMTERRTAENGSRLVRKHHGKFAPGNPGGPGRPKGLPNKINALLKDDILDAYEQRGGVKWLRSLTPRDFVRLLEKTMPREISADVRAVDERHRKVAITISHVNVLGANGGELDKVEAALSAGDIDAAQDHLPFLEKVIAQHDEMFPLAIGENDRAKTLQARIIQATGMMNR